MNIFRAFVEDFKAKWLRAEKRVADRKSTGRVYASQGKVSALTKVRVWRNATKTWENVEIK